METSAASGTSGRWCGYKQERGPNRLGRLVFCITFVRLHLQPFSPSRGRSSTDPARTNSARQAERCPLPVQIEMRLLARFARRGRQSLGCAAVRVPSGRRKNYQ
ncbi:unnamed protein product [Pleuronectes platessa]|uniref:Uncharacterized protein n=1 Tax=Pleuronectes platessa TaxID=8262 RepID=A0A9N7Y739_PLEPL|nr:unnamed protein product [Pleuronectes platessa]